MRKLFVVAILTVSFLPVAGVVQAQDDRPHWAYAVPPEPSPPRPPDDGTRYTLPGTDRTFTSSQIRGSSPADWYPGDHPAMPDIVANGRDPDIRACALCHYPNGKGRPENAGVAGHPVAYFIQQLHDFRADLRNTSEPRKGNAARMVEFAKAMTDAEIEAAAAYFGSMPWTPWIRVVETDTVPKTYVRGGIHLELEGAEAGTEPIGERIIETPENEEHAQVQRNPRSGFIAYVPVGAIAKGEALVQTGAGRTVACAVCHGPELKGLGPLPGLAGRSPSYVVRALYDMKQGTRKGLWADLMRPVVEGLSTEDMLNIAAYTASLAP